MQAGFAATTFLFTDIEGSTRLWEHEPARMRSALAVHDAIARSAIEGHRGLVVKTTGDGFHAAFDDPLDAISASLELQQRITKPDATTGLTLRVRCGIHLGIAERRDNEFFGTAVNRAARLMAAAHGGQVLISQEVASLIVHRLGENATLRDLGAVRLRDLSTHDHVFQLVHPRLRAEFPPLRSLEGTPNNLPQQLTAFIGRKHELAEIKRLLATARLLTLRGAGGIGKTQLALQVAADVIDEYPDGVWFVDLAPSSAPSLVNNTVAQTLGIKPDPSEPLTHTICSYLKPLRVLLILDNCEHLIEACARLSEDLLLAAPRLRILATSREALRVAGEQTYRLPSLSLPDATGDIESVARSDAVQLFVERARLHQQGFALTAERAPAIAELCIRLDGMPLALELAAARVRVLPVEKIVERLNDRFRLLTAGSRTSLPRHQTLRATITWSFDLLSEVARVLFARLSIFAGGFNLEAAEGVASGSKLSHDDVLDLLSSLIDKSLVLPETSSGRYRLLETIREYARDCLRVAGEEAAIRERHFNWYLQLAEQVEPSLLGGPMQKPALDLLEADHENLRAALAWSLEVPERSNLALRLCGTLYRFWSRRGYWTEGYRACMKALAQPPQLGDKAARARVLLTAGSVGNNVPEAETRVLLEDALALSREAGDRSTEATTLNNLARVLDWDTELSRARVLLEQARQINRELGNKTLELHNMSNLVNVLRRQHEPAAALALAEEGLATSRISVNRWLEAIFLYLLGRVALDRGDIGTAQRSIEQALAIARELVMPDWQSFSLVKLAFLAVVRDDVTSARCHLTEAIDISRRFGGRLNLAECFSAMGVLASHTGHHDKAARLWGVAKALLGSLISSDVLDPYLMDPYQAKSRQALGGAAYDAARAEGRAWSRERAIDQAIVWLAEMS